jgi:hypothetical protein
MSGSLLFLGTSFYLRPRHLYLAHLGIPAFVTVVASSCGG